MESSDHEKGIISHHLAKKARNSRRQRLMLQQTNSSRRKNYNCSGLFLHRSRKFSFKRKLISSHGGAKSVLKAAAKLEGPLKTLEQSCCNSSVMNLVHIDKKEENKKERVKSSSATLMGRRRVMEDAVTVTPETIAGKYEFFGVFDGHGGDRVAKACRERLHKLVQNELEESIKNPPRGRGEGGDDQEGSTSSQVSGNSVVDWEKVMRSSFCRMDDEVVLEVGDSDRDGIMEEGEEAVGSTAVVVMVGEEEVVVANCGDSRAVLCRGGVAMPLSTDHKPERPDERERVEAAGGRILEWNGCRVEGILSTSRSIGDHYLKAYVISEPEVTVTRRTESDEFLIIASDGLWDVVTNEFVCELVRKCLQGGIGRSGYLSKFSTEDAATILTQLALAKGSKDNISVTVVELKIIT